jgi:hypothetical protein
LSRLESLELRAPMSLATLPVAGTPLLPSVRALALTGPGWRRYGHAVTMSALMGSSWTQLEALTLSDLFDSGIGRERQDDEVAALLQRCAVLRELVFTAQVQVADFRWLPGACPHLHTLHFLQLPPHGLSAVLQCLPALPHLRDVGLGSILPSDGAQLAGALLGVRQLAALKLVACSTEAFVDMAVEWGRAHSWCASLERLHLELDRRLEDVWILRSVSDFAARLARLRRLSVLWHEEGVVALAAGLLSRARAVDTAGDSCTPLVDLSITVPQLAPASIRQLAELVSLSRHLRSFQFACGHNDAFNGVAADLPRAHAGGAAAGPRWLEAPLTSRPIGMVAVACCPRLQTLALERTGVWNALMPLLPWSPGAEGERGAGNKGTGGGGRGGVALFGLAPKRMIARRPGPGRLAAP